MLVRNYDAIFTHHYVKEIAKTIPKFMLVNADGIMLGG